MSKINMARQMNAALRLLAQNLDITDSEKMQIADLYPAWGADMAYAAGTTVKYGVNTDGETQLYSVVQGHTSQADWTPEVAVSLFKKVGFTDEGLPVWTQPLGAFDAYNTGDRVSHAGEVWVSDIDGNVWEPGVYGWTKGVN